jgi:hypothetical protein
MERGSPRSPWLMIVRIFISSSLLLAPCSKPAPALSAPPLVHSTVLRSHRLNSTLFLYISIFFRLTRYIVVNKARDADIVATATVLSLKCPLSTLRIELPCRSIACKHNQCFDATSYLQLQEQGPTWLCPICNNSAPFDTLAVDE